jgi:CDP-diacylglycerol--glycerol-3-phosphate 3-phosphatidyltransferase
MFISDSKTMVMISFFVFSIAALTDWYDGWYARKYGFRTRWGQFLDPLADKILTSAALLCFYIINKREPGFFGENEIVPIGILIGIIIVRDLVLTLARSVSELRGREFNTSMISKTKTFAQMTYIFLVIGSAAAVAAFGTEGFGSIAASFLFSNLNYYILFIITILTVASGVAYIFESGGKSPVKEAE